MGEAEALYGWGSADCGCMFVDIGLDWRASGLVRKKSRNRRCPGVHTLGAISYQVMQAKSCTIGLAVLSIYAVDFAINAGISLSTISLEALGLTRMTVQSSCRSLIVDTLPISKQQLGSAWGKRLFQDQCERLLRFQSQ